MRSDYRGVPAGKFVHEKGILCAELPQCKKFVHETFIPCTKYYFSVSNPPELPQLPEYPESLEFPGFAESPESPQLPDAAT